MNDRLRRERSSPDYPRPLDIDLAAPEPIPEEGIERATQLMRTGTDLAKKQPAYWWSQSGRSNGDLLATAQLTGGGAELG